MFSSIFWKCLAISQLSIYKNEETIILKTQSTTQHLFDQFRSSLPEKTHLLRSQRNSPGPERLCLPFPISLLNFMRTIHPYTRPGTPLPGEPNTGSYELPTNPSGPGTHTHSPVITTRSRQHPQPARRRRAAATAAAAH